MEKERQIAVLASKSSARAGRRTTRNAYLFLYSPGYIFGSARAGGSLVKRSHRRAQRSPSTHERAKTTRFRDRQQTTDGHVGMHSRKTLGLNKTTRILSKKGERKGVLWNSLEKLRGDRGTWGALSDQNRSDREQKGGSKQKALGL